MSEQCNFKRKTTCVMCRKPFTESNVFTMDGWRETQISSMCEKCFDEICAEPEEDAEDNHTRKER